MAPKKTWRKYKGSRDTTQHPARVPDRSVHDFERVFDDLPHISATPSDMRDEKETWRAGWYYMNLLYGIVIKNNLYAERKLENSGFGPLLTLELPKSSKRLCGSLVECWWDTTHTFHFPRLAIGITPLDFTFLTVIVVGSGRILPYGNGPSESNWEDVYDKYFSELDHVENSKTVGIYTSVLRDWLTKYVQFPDGSAPPSLGKHRQLYQCLFYG